MANDVEDLVNLFFHQYTIGCGRINCPNSECASCLTFQHNFKDKNEAALYAIESLLEYNHNSHLCDGMEDFIITLRNKNALLSFDIIIRKMINSNNTHDFVNLDGIRKAFNVVVSEHRLFPWILMNFEKQLSPSNLEIDDELVHEFVILTKTNAEIFQNSKAGFLRMIKSFLKQPSDTLYHVRGLILALTFEIYYEVSDFRNCLIPILKHIVELPELPRELLFTTLEKLPRIIKHINDICQNLLTLFLLTNESFNPSDEVFIVLSKFLTYLRNFSAFNCSKCMFNSKSFSSDEFSGLLIQNLKLFFCGKNKDFLDYPALLSLNLKYKLFYTKQEYKQKLIEHQLALCRVITGNARGMSNLEFIKSLRLNITVRRDHLVEDTIDAMEKVSDDKLFRKFMVTFRGEKGVDAGGVSREFFQLITEDLFSPDYGMFILLDNKFYWFNPAESQFGINNYQAYKTLGKIVSIAIYNSINLPIRFPLLLYKKILKKKLTLNDLAEVDPDFVKGSEEMLKMKRNHQDVADLMLNFTTTIEAFGSKMEIPLVKNGENIDVTNDNLELYIDKYLEWYTSKSIQNAYNAFIEGFNIICSNDFFHLFTPDELDILVSGEEILDWNELKKSCKYSEGYTPNSKEIKMFWEIFNEFSNKMKLKFLQFTTGTNRAPVGGLKNLKITIQKNDNVNRLPTAHTCFNIFELPNYKTKKEMKNKITIALTHSEGFGFI